MPPRQPLKLAKPAKATAKPSKSAVVRKTASAEAAQVPVKQASTPSAGKTASHAGSRFSLYPDLTMAIAMLEKRRKQLAIAGISPLSAETTAPAAGSGLRAKQQELIDKWLVSLKKVQAEITRLRQLEKLSQSLSSPATLLQAGSDQ